VENCPWMGLVLWVSQNLFQFGHSPDLGLVEVNVPRGTICG